MNYIIHMAYILKKRLKGRTYYYLAEAQRINGKPRIVWQKYLGTADKIKKKLLETEQEVIEGLPMASTHEEKARIRREFERILV